MHPINLDFWLRLGVIHSSLSGRQHHDRTVPDTASDTLHAASDNLSGDSNTDCVDTFPKEDHGLAVFTGDFCQHLLFSCASLQRARSVNY